MCTARTQHIYRCQIGGYLTWVCERTRYNNLCTYTNRVMVRAILCPIDYSLITIDIFLFLYKKIFLLLSCLLSRSLVGVALRIGNRIYCIVLNQSLHIHLICILITCVYILETERPTDRQTDSLNTRISMRHNNSFMHQLFSSFPDQNKKAKSRNLQPCNHLSFRFFRSLSINFAHVFDLMDFCMCAIFET